MQEPHLNIIRDKHGYYVEVAQGADRITLTPTLATSTEANQALKLIQSATQLPIGRRSK